MYSWSYENSIDTKVCQSFSRLLYQLTEAHIRILYWKILEDPPLTNRWREQAASLQHPSFHIPVTYISVHLIIPNNIISCKPRKVPEDSLIYASVHFSFPCEGNDTKENACIARIGWCLASTAVEEVVQFGCLGPPNTRHATLRQITKQEPTWILRNFQ